MVKFEESVPTKQDHIFVEKDPVRVYRGLKDMLVDEFDMDRVETGDRMEFYSAKPKDRIRLYAFKEKSPHTVIRIRLSLDAKPIKYVESIERPEDMLKAKIKIGGSVITMYPGGEPISWLPEKWSQKPHPNWERKTGLRAEHRSRFQKSRFYRILVGIWYNKFYSKEIHMYEEEAKETILHLHDLMREKFGAEKTIGRTDASHFKPTWK